MTDAELKKELIEYSQWLIQECMKSDANPTMVYGAASARLLLIEERWKESQAMTPIVPTTHHAPISTPRNADGSVNYAYLDRGEWWKANDTNGIGRGWVRNERFGQGTVIPGARRKARK